MYGSCIQGERRNIEIKHVNHMVLIGVIKIQKLLFLLVASVIHTCSGKYIIILLLFVPIFLISQDKRQLPLSIISGKILIFSFAMCNKPPTTAWGKHYYSFQLLNPHLHTINISIRSHSLRAIQNTFILFSYLNFFFS